MKETEERNLNKPLFIFRLIDLIIFSCPYFSCLSTVTCPMNEVLTASTGVIMSQSPGSGFPHFESCSWVVKVEPGYNITFTIEHFQTSRQFDELEIFDGKSAYVIHTKHTCLCVRVGVCVGVTIRVHTNGYISLIKELTKHCIMILPWVMHATSSVHLSYWSFASMTLSPNMLLWSKTWFHKYLHYTLKWAKQL